jgi:hypothetical protein
MGQLKVHLGGVVNEANSVFLFIDYHQTCTNGQDNIHVRSTIRIELSRFWLNREGLPELRWAQRYLRMNHPRNCTPSEVFVVLMLLIDSIYDVVVSAIEAGG